MLMYSPYNIDDAYDCLATGPVCVCVLCFKIHIMKEEMEIDLAPLVVSLVPPYPPGLRSESIAYLR